MLTFVLVHGSWHDGSAWNAVIQLLSTIIFHVKLIINSIFMYC